MLMTTLALDVPRLLKRISHKEGDRMSSRDYQRDIAEEFTAYGEKLSPIAIERWRQRGSIPTPRLLLLLKIAEKRRIQINLLDFSMPGEVVESYKQTDRATKARQKMKIEALLSQAKAADDNPGAKEPSGVA